MSITMGTTASAGRANVSRPRRLHHAAWITRDQEATRQFYEDIIGLPLEAAWAERGPTGREYCHTFFTLGDGGALAFFQYADQADHPVELSSPGHIAFECDSATQNGIKERLETSGYELRGGTHLVLRTWDERQTSPVAFDVMVDNIDAAHAQLKGDGMAVTESILSRDERLVSPDLLAELSRAHLDW